MSLLRSTAKVMLSLAIFLTLPNLAQAQPADPKAAAREHYRNGERKFDLGKYDEAAAEFQQAYELIGDPVILYNIGKAYQLAQNTERALFFYRTYLRKVEGAPNRAEVQGRIKDLEHVLEQSKRASAVPPQGILHPNDLNRPTPEQPPPVTTQPEQPKPEQPKPVEPPPPVATPQPEQPPPPAPVDTEARRKTLRAVGYALAGLTVAGVATGIAFGVLSQNANNLVESSAKDGGFVWDQTLNDKQSNAHTYDSVQIAGYVVGGVAAAGAAVCLYLGFKPKKAEQARLLPYGSPSGAGLTLSGHF